MPSYQGSTSSSSASSQRRRQRSFDDARSRIVPPAIAALRSLLQCHSPGAATVDMTADLGVELSEEEILRRDYTFSRA